MKVHNAKYEALLAGLELYWDRQWKCWGLIDPTCRASESEWMSSYSLHEMTNEQFTNRIETMLQRIEED